MKDFSYCIWLSPHPEHPWYNNTNGFIPHISLKTNLHYEAAIEMFDNINLNVKPYKHNYINPVPINIKLEDLTISKDEDFHSLYYTVKLLNLITKPSWWPSNAHMSFFYKYDNAITNIEKQNCVSNILTYSGILSKIHLVKCKDHFKTWEIIKTK